LSRSGTSQATLFDNQYTSDAWSWLQFNDTLPSSTLPEVGSVRQKFIFKNSTSLSLISPGLIHLQVIFVKQCMDSFK